MSYLSYLSYLSYYLSYLSYLYSQSCQSYQTYQSYQSYQSNQSNQSNQSINQSIDQSINLSIYLCIYLSIYLSIYLLNLQYFRMGIKTALIDEKAHNQWPEVTIQIVLLKHLVTIHGWQRLGAGNIGNSGLLTVKKKVAPAHHQGFSNMLRLQLQHLGFHRFRDLSSATEVESVLASSSPKLENINI